MLSGRSENLAISPTMAGPSLKAIVKSGVAGLPSGAVILGDRSKCLTVPGTSSTFGSVWSHSKTETTSTARS